MRAQADIYLKSIQGIARSSEVQHLLTTLGSDADLHIVGGMLREAVLGNPLNDLDLATALHPAETLARLEHAGIHCVPTGLQHQTVTAVFDKSFGNIEITSFRASGMNPEGGVFLSDTIEEDLGYRDFTINAMAWNLTRETLVDPYQGLEDINNGVIRSVGPAEERFAEDPLRVLRMLRFVSVLGFAIDPPTLETARNFKKQLYDVSIERIRDEFSKTLLGEYVGDGLNLLMNLELFEVVIPEMVVCQGFEQNRFHSKDVFQHTIEVVEKTRKDLVLRLSALLHDIGKPPSLSIDDSGERHFYKHERIGAELSREILHRLKYSNRIIDDVCTLVETHMRPITAGAPGLRRLLRDTENVFPLWRELKEADASSVRIDRDVLEQQLQEFDENIDRILSEPNVSPLKNLAVNGKDLIDLGAKPGPKFGMTLRALHELVLDDPSLNTKEVLIGVIKERYLDEL